jgi:hypothetical protein
MVNKERMELWIQALEQDRFTKCTGSLRMGFRNEDGSISYRHCVLGIGVEIAIENGLFEGHPLFGSPGSDTTLVFHSGGGYLPTAVALWYGLENENPEIEIDGEPFTISGLNDANNYCSPTRAPLSHWNIAQYMRTAYLKDDVS